MDILLYNPSPILIQRLVLLHNLLDVLELLDDLWVKLTLLSLPIAIFIVVLLSNEELVRFKSFGTELLEYLGDPFIANLSMEDLEDA